MASKVIGFRIPEDVAEELEKASEELGMTVAEFMRSLVDETLYPATDNKDQEKGDTVTTEQLELLANEHKNLVDQVESLYVLINQIGEKIAGYEIEGILSPKIVDTIQEMKRIKSDINSLENKVDTLSMKLKSTQDTIKLVNEYKKSSDRSYSELQKEVSIMRLQLAAMNNLSSKVNQLESKVPQHTKDIAQMKIELKLQPTGEIRTITYDDGSEHNHMVYKSPAGLVKPYMAYTTLSGRRYVDLTKPLD